jgi:periplasmic divalent cation tolerance protein
MISLIYTTINNEKDAKKIANYLLEEQIVACVNIIPNVHSIYRWKGKIEEEKEFILIAKTKDENVIKAINKIKKLHTYEIPDIISIAVNNGYSEYLDYIKRETE